MAAPSKSRTLKREASVYLDFCLKEVLNVSIYITAAVIGFTICFFTGHYSVVPFIVPMFVQILARSSVKYRQRHVQTLVQLPAQKEDPVFIMDMDGAIVLSTGKTLELFETRTIRNAGELIGRAALSDLLDMIQKDTAEPPVEHVMETYSRVTEKWYEIKAKSAGTKLRKRTGNVLVWFQDITRRKVYDLRLRDLLHYSDSLIFSLDDLVETDSVFEHLASFLLQDYDAVFITRTDASHNLVGMVFKGEGREIKQSQTITIPKDSKAPINVSRHKAEIISDERSAYPSRADFLKQNPLDPRVLEFIGVPVRNFITYNQADVSIIAFNFSSDITAYERRFFEIMVNLYRTMVMLVDSERERTRPSDT